MQHGRFIKSSSSAVTGSVKERMPQSLRETESTGRPVVKQLRDEVKEEYVMFVRLRLHIPLQ